MDDNLFESEISDGSKSKKTRNLAMGSLNPDDDIELQNIMQNLGNSDDDFMKK